ncbi:MAG: HEAT repeat domain-containing protein [Planctomycetes bacterium]|nr:HEAT repeat domain-containing protein [Planctomycetota bacterium]
MRIATQLDSLPEDYRRALSEWLRTFEQGWTPTLLAEQARQVPESSARRAILVEMIKVDLRKRWGRGQTVLVEEYLKAYPELGGRDGVPADLVGTEYEVRRTRGDAVDFDDYRRRFPAQAALLPAAETLNEPPATTPGAPLAETPLVLPTRQPSQAPPLLDVAGGAAGDLPEQFGRYRILKKLGQGGMGSVYLAHDTRLDRQVAVKVPSARLTGDLEGRERFYREARAASAFNHPNLCPVFDVDEVGGIHYLTMPFVEGRPLSDLLRGGGPLPQRQVAALVQKLALAMQEAHQKGVVHRDLKPANVMVTPRHEPVIMDFGLARRDSGEDPRLTSAGQVMGTPAYMAPEQVRGDVAAVGPASDVYSLGVILYELLTGRLPFSGTVGQIFADVLGREPAPPSRHRPDLDPALEAVCRKAMAKDARARFASMDAFAAALAAYLGEEPAHPVPARDAGITVSVVDAPGSPPVADAPGSPAQATELMAQLLARLDRPPRRSVAVWAGAAAAAFLALLGVVVFLIVRQEPAPVENRVSVRLGDLHLTNLNVQVNTTNVVFILNGEPVSPDQLRGEVELPVGENRLVVKRGDEVVEERVFHVGRDDNGETVRVLPDESVEKKEVAVSLAGIKVDEREEELTFFLDGKAVPLAQLRDKLALRPGMHVLVVKRSGTEVESNVFAVKADDGGKSVPVALHDYRRVTVTLKLPAVDRNDPALEVLLDGRKVSFEELEKPLHLLPGNHVLVLRRGTDEERESFSVTRANDGKSLQLALAGPRAHAAADPPGGSVKPSEAVQAILPLVEDKDPSVRKEAASGLATLKDRTAVPALCKLLGDSDPGVRKTAAEGLEKLRDRSAVAALRRRVEDNVWFNPWIIGVEDPEAGGKTAALRALRALAPEQVTSALVVALKGKEGHMRRWAARELASQEDRKKVVPALRELVAMQTWYQTNYRGDHDPEWGGKATALVLLRELAPEQVTAALSKALGGSHYAMRRWAAEELGRHKDRAALPALKERVADELWYAREYSNIDPDPVGGGKAAALKALRDLAFDEATEPLTRALFSKYTEQRYWAAVELKVQGDKAAVPALKKRIADETWDPKTFDTAAGGGKTAALKALKALAPGEVKVALAQAAGQKKNADVRKWAVARLVEEGQN